MIKRAANFPARWRLFACGLLLLAGCPVAAQAGGWVPSLLRTEPLKLEANAELPVPTRISHGRFTSKFAHGVTAPTRRTLSACIPAAFSDVLAFYRTELPKLGWQEMSDSATIAAAHAELSYASPQGPVTLKLGREKDETTVELVQRNTEAAAKAHYLPLPGQARLIFGYLVPDVASLAINDQTIQIAGGLNNPQTLDVPPGTYAYELHVSGRLVRTDTITVGAGEAWSLKLSDDDSTSDQIY